MTFEIKVALHLTPYLMRIFRRHFLLSDGLLISIAKFPPYFVDFQST